jgi:hypothetical protein
MISLNSRVNKGYSFKAGSCLVYSYAEVLKFDMGYLVLREAQVFNHKLGRFMMAQHPVFSETTTYPSWRSIFPGLIGYKLGLISWNRRVNRRYFLKAGSCLVHSYVEVLNFDMGYLALREAQVF